MFDSMKARFHMPQIHLYMVTWLTSAIHRLPHRSRGRSQVGVSSGQEVDCADLQREQHPLLDS